MRETGREIVRTSHALLDVKEFRELLEQQPATAVRNVHWIREKVRGAYDMKRAAIFARDGHRCVYCGVVYEPDELSVDHVQPKMRGGDGSWGNVVTACRGCNTAKGGERLSHFLARTPEARRNFFHFARYVWPRTLKAVAEELARRGVVERPADFVEGVRLLRSSEAIAELLLEHTQGNSPVAE